MKNLLVIILVLTPLLSACGASQPAAPQTPGIALTDCLLTAPGSIAQLTAQCGTLSVPENRVEPMGRTIELFIAVVPAISRSPAPDPLFFLTGGPGQAATESGVLLSTAFEQVHQKRDIVLVDQRGTGKSNPLKCPALDEAPPSEAETQRFVQNCLDALDADPTQYTTTIAMQDLDAVRQALGYEQINLYGVSYGTRAAQTYMKMFPERVRSAVLDGVVPQSEPLGMYVAQDAQRALDLIFAHCLADSSCNRAFPGVGQDFNALVERLRTKAQEVHLVDPLSGAPTSFSFGQPELASAVRLLSYTPETAALLPLLVNDADREGDLNRLAAQYLIVAGQLNESISQGMNYSVLCAEDQPFIDREQVQRLNRGTYLGDLQMDELAEICAVWPAGQVPADFHAPLESQTPVLLLSGEVDPVTPPAKAEEVARFLPNSRSIVVQGQGHNVVFRGCLPWLMTDFIESASVEKLDLTCLEEITPAPFFLNFSGPVMSEKP
ncbi:MAG: hypothetical protein B6D39_09110 [Anaerolineae bacterium UTCFX2]|jgi:pimeloyl-ACP methyl ester carboxylesterase|nr:alpha/beta hydrolase [Anaerolineae bacterium]MCZ7553779.1 alpha/beta hydrolase [Anaerolineales bacterium]OQY89829.1 MAG: hypothetical protein B6D39_09110 [Anaerolineae bacterium UTCFX2]